VCPFWQMTSTSPSPLLLLLVPLVNIISALPIKVLRIMSIKYVITMMTDSVQYHCPRHTHIHKIIGRRSQSVCRSVSPYCSSRCDMTLAMNAWWGSTSLPQIRQPLWRWLQLYSSRPSPECIAVQPADTSPCNTILNHLTSFLLIRLLLYCYCYCYNVSQKTEPLGYFQIFLTNLDWY